MSSQGNGPPARFKVDMSAQTREALKQLQQEAIQSGKGAGFLSSARMIIARLHTEPRELGEPLYRLPALKLLVFQAVIPPLVVDYAVHEEIPYVFIRKFRLL
jgi:hypothetical protein